MGPTVGKGPNIEQWCHCQALWRRRCDCESVCRVATLQEFLGVLVSFGILCKIDRNWTMVPRLQLMTTQVGTYIVKVYTEIDWPLLCIRFDVLFTFYSHLRITIFFSFSKDDTSMDDARLGAAELLRQRLCICRVGHTGAWRALRVESIKSWLAGVMDWFWI